MGLLNRWPKLLRWVLSGMLALFVLMTAYRFFFFYTYASPGRSLTGSAIVLGMRYDARVVCIMGLAMLLLCFIPFFNPFRNGRAKKIWPVILSICWLLVLLFYVADFYHYDYLQDRLNASVLNFFEDAAISFTMMRQTYPLFSMTIVIISLVVLAWWLNKKLIHTIASGGVTVSNKNRKWYFIPSILLMGLFIFGRLGQYPLRWSDAFTLKDDFKSNVALNPFQSFFSTLKFRHSTFDLSKVKELYPMMANYLGLDSSNAGSLNFSRTVHFERPTSESPNIVVVLCESFSMYKSSMSGNPLNTTPFFNGLTREGVFFERCFTPSLSTARGVWALITGIPDVQRPNTASRNPANVDQHSVINDLKNYDKFYFLGGSTTWANIRGLLTNNIEGLQIREEDSFEAPREDVWGISDKELFYAANETFAKQTKPFFSIIQTAGNHRPYTIPPQDLAEFKKISQPMDTLLKYGFRSNEELNAFRYSDYCFQKFFEVASKQPYFANTLFVFVGDHGIPGAAEHIYPKSFTKNLLTGEHVPLLFYWKNKLTPQTIRTVCSQVDVLPTALSIVKQPYRNTTLGIDLLDSTVTNRERVAFINQPSTQTIGLVTDEYYFYKGTVTNELGFVSVLDNNPVPENDSTRQQMAYLSRFTDAWYQTSKYLLLNNKKRK